MLPDKKSTSFTWLQGTKKLTSEGDKQEKLNLKEEEMDMDVDMSIPQTPHTVSKITITDYSDAWKENKLNHHQQQQQQQQQQKRKRMTRMGASSLIRRTSASGKQYFSMEQDLREEDESLFADEDTSGNSKDSSSSLTQKLNKTIKDVKTSIGNLSQKFRRSTRRRYALGLGESASMVDISPTRRILGRTPTKLYSPFGFDSPLSRPPMRRLEHPTTPQMMRRTSLAVASRIQRGSPQTRMGLRDLKNSPIINRQSFRF